MLQERSMSVSSPGYLLIFLLLVGEIEAAEAPPFDPKMTPKNTFVDSPATGVVAGTLLGRYRETVNHAALHHAPESCLARLVVEL